MEHLSPLGAVYQAGTLSGNPVSVAAGLATLAEIQKPGLYEAPSATASSLAKGINAAASRTHQGFSAASVGGMFGLFASPKPPTSYVEVMQAGKETFNRFFHKMLDAGVHLAPSAYEAGFVSAAHTQSVIDETLAAAERAMQSI